VLGFVGGMVVLVVVVEDFRLNRTVCMDACFQRVVDAWMQITCASLPAELVLTIGIMKYLSVVVLLKASGDAPIMKQTKFKVRDISSHGVIIGVPTYVFNENLWKLYQRISLSITYWKTEYVPIVRVSSFQIIMITRGSYAIPCVSLIFPSDVGN
jgi:hypothetical protein